MKRIPLLIALVLTFSFGLALAQGGEVYVVTTGLSDNGGTPGVGVSTSSGADITFHVYFINGTGDYVSGTTNGFRIHGPDNFVAADGNWVNFDTSDPAHQWYGFNTYDDPPDDPEGPFGPVDRYRDLFDGVNQITERSADGLLSDTVTLAVSVQNYRGMPDGFDDEVMAISTGVPAGLAQLGQELCIDSAFWPPSGTWLWAPGGVPEWGGPYCFEIFEIQHIPPDMVNCPSDHLGSHCVGVEEQFQMVVTPGQEGGPFTNTFVLVSGPPMLDPVTGIYTYTPSLADVGTPVTVQVQACDELGCGPTICTYNMNFTNEAPVFQGDPYYTLVQMGSGKTVTVEATDACFDPIMYNLLSVTPTPDPLSTYGLGGVDGNELTFNTTAPGDGGLVYTFLVEATDGNMSDTAEVVFDVLAVSGFTVIIEKTHNTPQGQHEMVPVNFSGSDVLLGFDILISYDASALTLTNVVEGDIYDDCMDGDVFLGNGWEYFTFRYGPFGNCGNACPSGMVRVVGIAETNNGPNHPYVTEQDPASNCPGVDLLFSLDFLVSDDRTLECMYVPVRFYWMDCGDNSLAYYDAVEECWTDMVLQGIERNVYEFDALLDEVLDPSTEALANATSFPTYYGVIDECYDNTGDSIWCEATQDSIVKPGPQAWVDFVNGGIDIVCADSIDARGDINLNNQAYEIADAVLFSNYFISGLGVFTVNPEGQIAASDCNADGMVLSVADLVYLIRVVVGDALPYAKLNPVGATYTADNGFVTVDQPMGAAYIVVAGNVAPTLLAENMDMQYAYDGQNTRILVSSMEMGQTFEGQFIAVNGNVISVEMATYEGAPVVAKELPSEYALAQNYPNPFNPATNIGFSLKNAGDYKLTIYNVTGQTVAEFAGAAEAGQHTITWDASNQASGIYFYKLSTDNFSDTKKMVLLK